VIATLQCGGGCRLQDGLVRQLAAVEKVLACRAQLDACPHAPVGLLGGPRLNADRPDGL
jgi:hypothetical protein